MHLDLSYNELEGGIPPTILECENLEHVAFSHNKLSGDVPDGLINDLRFVEHSPQKGGALLKTTTKPQEHGKENSRLSLDLSRRRHAVAAQQKADTRDRGQDRPTDCHLQLLAEELSCMPAATRG